MLLSKRCHLIYLAQSNGPTIYDSKIDNEWLSCKISASSERTFKAKAMIVCSIDHWVENVHEIVMEDHSEEP